METALVLPAQVPAPVAQGQELGCMEVTVEGKTVARVPLVADRAVERLTVGGIYKALLRQLGMAR